MSINRPLISLRLPLSWRIKHGLLMSYKSPKAKKQIQHMNQIFSEQTAAFRKNPMPSLEERIANLKKLRRMLMDNQDELISCISQDFSGRSATETKLAEVMTVVHTIDYTLKNLKKWMAPVKKKNIAFCFSQQRDSFNTNHLV